MFKDLSFFPPSASTVASSVDGLYFFLVGLSVFFTVLIFALVVFFAIRFRARKDGPGAQQFEGSMKLEIVWTVIPLIIVMFIFVWGTRVWFTLQHTPANAMQFYCTGKQWMWKLQHPTGQREINTLHIPTGVPIELHMISEDAIHSFYVPAFRVKRDVLPGRYSSLWFEATEPGTYHLFCAEFCGLNHSKMIGWVIAMKPEDYERWLAGTNPGESPRDQGEKLFASMRCDTCHSGQSGSRGPDLRGQFGQSVKLADGSTAVFDEEYVRESLMKPSAKLVAGFQALMPTYAGQLSEDQVLALVAYVKSLKDAGQGAAKP